ncbi:MAG: hypothetical protein VKJ02_18165 [Snowella sp.]|nr:hypothetical protein [Snowella sp.]
MLLFVICFNLCLTLLNLYIVVRLWHLQQYLKCLTRTFTKLEKCSHRLLAPAPANLIHMKQGTVKLRRYYQLLARQLMLLESLLQGLQVIRSIWRYQRKLIND